MRQCDAEKFYTEHVRLLKFTIKVLNYLPALRKLWRQNLVLRPGMRILDVGCGNGALTKTLWQRSVELKIDPISFFSFDITAELLNEFRQWIRNKEITNIRIIKADARKMTDDLPAKWENFDLICSSGALEHINKDDLVLTLEQLYKYLKPGGTMIVMGSRKHFINYFLIQGLYQANIYDKNEFAGLLRQAGFQKITYWKFPFPYFYLNGWGYIAVAKK